MEMPVAETFADFETRVDAYIDALPIAQLPARAILSRFHAYIFTCLHMSKGDAQKRFIGEILSYRLSYLLPWLSNRDWTELASGMQDVMAAFSEVDPTGDQMATLFKYSHFCELAPAVHRGQYIVESTTRGFSLAYPDENIATAEATDIIISELAINHISGSPFKRDLRILKMAATAPRIDFAAFVAVAKERSIRFSADLREQPLISEKSLRELFGFDRSTYRQIQSALFGLCSVSIELAETLYAQSLTNDDHEKFHEALEWVSICWSSEFFTQHLGMLANVAPETANRFLDRFTYFPDQAKQKRIGGEGFTPPFSKISTATLAAPDLVLTFCHERNAIQSLMRTDQKAFDNLISHDLEPTLLGAFRETLKDIKGLIVVSEKRYAGGEIDLLILNPATQHVVICEAKAPMPPQGVRATERLAGRMREGLAQLTKFRELGSQEQINVLNDITGQTLTSPTIHYAILGRACFGLHEVWHQKEVTPITLPLMRLAIAGLKDGSHDVAALLTATVSNVTEKILAEANWHWEVEATELCNSELTIPLLKYDHAVVDKWMREATA
ncbi:UNVERIFIED_ORG: hypothetical protein GGD59_000511 [Rhizobium esperanzae]